MFPGQAIVGAETVEQEVVLDVRGVETEFAGAGGVARAVRGVDFMLRRGRKIAVVGESGSGKSALALSILGLIEPPGRVTAGEVWLNGRDLRQLSEKQLQEVRGREIGFVYQDPVGALDPVKSIGAQIEESLRWHDRSLGRAQARRRAIELLREVEVPDAARRVDDYPHQYSGGMCQRVGIAIALANRPDVLIADEPTTALDVTTQAQVLELLGRLVAEHGTAVILITHNLGIVAEFCDEVNVMYAGRLVEQGTTDMVFGSHAHPYTEALLRSVPRGRGGSKLPFIPGFPPSLSNLSPGCSFEPRCTYSAGRARCSAEAPAREALLGGALVAECHFAAERVAVEAHS
jgi:oligopeptide/dipeptide ABC transporter ATP-binding protein